MPDPIAVLMDPISLGLLALYAALMAWEALLPARALPPVRGWRLRGLAAFVVYFYLSAYLPIFWNEALSSRQMFDLTSLGTWGGAAAGLLLYQLAGYGWHRAMHRSTFLWRVFHQMHHSAERLDTASAFWFSPADMIGWTVLGSLVLTGLVGLTPEAATLVLLASTFIAMFTHSNVRTPRWLGYLIQRPESHSLHHERGVHARNYGDLPVFDLLFGSFSNPRDFAAEAGFYDGASSRVVEMLCARDVSAPRPLCIPLPLRGRGSKTNPFVV